MIDLFSRNNVLILENLNIRTKELAEKYKDMIGLVNNSVPVRSNSDINHVNVIQLIIYLKFKTAVIKKSKRISNEKNSYNATVFFQFEAYDLKTDKFVSYMNVEGYLYSKKEYGHLTEICNKLYWDLEKRLESDHITFVQDIESAKLLFEFTGDDKK